MRFFSEILRLNISKNIGLTTKLKEVDESTCHGQTFLLKIPYSKTILTLCKSSSEKEGKKLPK